MKQGDIILMDFDPTKGREQSGYRPAVVISRTAFNQKRDLAILCPITSSAKPLRLHIPLDNRTHIQGNIICEQVRTIDLLARKCKIVERLPKDLLEKVMDAVSAIIAMDEDESN